MFSGWDKAWVPFILSAVGIAVYLGFLTQDQAASFGDFLTASVVPFVQAVLVYFVPNKS